MVTKEEIKSEVEKVPGERLPGEETGHAPLLRGTLRV